MMQKQISKKKLDRMTMHGGDFRQAGKRAGSQLTLPYLRELLEDDVRNLDRMMSGNDMVNGSDNDTGGGGNGNSTGSGGSAVLDGGTDIPQAELDMLLDRERLFATVTLSLTATSTTTSTTTTTTTTASDDTKEEKKEDGDEEEMAVSASEAFRAIPTEGSMYDIVAPQQSNLQTVA